MPEKQKESTPHLVAQGSDGEVIAERYRIVCEVGEGGMGVVYRAKHISLPREVAVKMLRETLCADEAARARFANEARAAAALSHPNIVSVHDHGFTADGRPYLVMDFAEGTSLAEVLRKRGSLSPAEAVDLLRQIARGVGHAHSKGVVHRDLKPSNVLVHEGTARVLDFGIAKVNDGENAAVTRTGEVFGTSLYMSPEQCNGHQLDGRSDVYSLGCILYECLTGKPPFSADSALAIAVQHLQNPVPQLVVPGADASTVRALDFVIRKAMAKSPADRFQTAEEYASHLDMVFSGVMPGSARASTARRTNWLPFAVLGSLALVGAAVMFFFVPKPPEAVPPVAPPPVVIPPAASPPQAVLTPAQREIKEAEALLGGLEAEGKARTPEYAGALVVLAAAHHKNLEFEPARKLYQQSLQLQQEMDGDPLFMIHTRQCIGNTYLHSMNLEKAEKALTSTLAEWKQKVGTNDSRYLANAMELSVCYLQMGRDKEATALFTKSAANPNAPHGAVANIWKYHFEPKLRQQGNVAEYERLKKLLKI